MKIPRKSLDFQIDNNHYFVNAGTLVELAIEDLSRQQKVVLRQLDYFKRELLFLDKNYKLVKKNSKKLK